MSGSEWLSAYLDRYRHDVDYVTERLLLEINEQIVERMQARGLRRSDVATRMGVSRAFVTQLLKGNANVTLKTLVKFAEALNLGLEVRLTPRNLAILRAAYAREFPREALRAGSLQGKLGLDESAIAA